MLPAKGYLKSINCPFFDTCICERPYCHYKHNKKDASTVNTMNTELISEIVSKAVHKVLQENSTTTATSSSTITTTSSSANNVTYNPTPIAQLNKYKNENIVQVKKHIPIQYTPEQPRSLRKIQTNPSIDYVPSLINEKTIQHDTMDIVKDSNIREDTYNEVPKILNDYISDDDDDDDDDDSDESTLDQCKRIFEEYKVPTSTTEQSTINSVKTDDSPPSFPTSVLTKKRIAYESSNNIEKDVIKRATIKNPAVVMANRYNLKLKRSPDINNECPIKSKRIASVPNVSALLDAKKSIDSMIRKSATQSQSVTIAKVKQRIAHVPDVCLTDVPTVRHANKSKLPVNIRSRFLYLIVKECVKLYVSKQAAYERALNEEFNCYVKCSAINSYKNAIMLLINRLRKEISGTPTPCPSGHVFAFDESKLYEHFRKWTLTDEELYENGFPRLGALRKGHAIFKKNKTLERIPENSQQCARCKKIFKIKDNGYPALEEDCIYHPSNRIVVKGEAKYACCQQISLRKGCCICSTHVFEITNPDKLTGFVCTFEPEPSTNQDPRSGKVYALDCEMVYTTRGLELARVTIIDVRCNVCYESLVRPAGDILDCNTRFSGLTVDVLQNVKTRMTDVQAALLLMFNSRTILVGHSFESDLKALRLIHNCVVDTSVLFPHKMGPPKKRALRTLASDFLKKIIQNDEGGHDSAEDAVTCMELLIWKLKEELKTK